jgi:Regulator of polyketide synthase expression
VGRTDRPKGAAKPGVSPDRASSTALPTIRDVLRLDQMVTALPEVLASEAALDRPVRWVHVSETADAAHLVSGGELILSTGVGWPTEAAELRSFARQLVEAGIAGLVLELGHRFVKPPEPFAEACRALGLPFVVLHREARFVEITEAVHARIITDQMIALRARDEIHALFTELSLRGSPADFIVAQVGRVLSSPVVLEDLSHRVIAVESGGHDDDVLRNWEQRSRAVHVRSDDSAGDATRRGGVEQATQQDARGWLIVPVEARGIRWGYLVALPGAQHPADRINVLEQAAVALALSRLADRDSDEWVRTSHDRMINALLGRRFSSDRALVERFEAAGFPVASRTMIGLAIRVRAGTVAPGDVLAAVAELGAPALAATTPAGVPHAVVVAVSLQPAQHLSDVAVTRFVRSITEASGTDLSDALVAIGADAHSVPGLLSSLEQAIELLARPTQRKQRGPQILRVEDRPLLRLLNAFGDDPRLQTHSERMLRPLIEYDLKRDGDLLDVLNAYTTYPGNRTRAAAASHLSRSVFYQRIALIEQLLGVTLDDGEVVSALHAALLARRGAP